MTADTAPGTGTIVYGGYADLLKPESPWVIGGFAGWQYREPDAVVIVQNGTLRVTVMPLTRGHDAVQILDNAKHMYFSRETFAVPPGGALSVELDIRARKFNGVPDDFYDGFVSLNLLDFSTGLAIDFFVSNESYATVYARLPFPGTQVAAAEGEQKYFALFKEQPLPNGPQRRHRYRIEYDHGADELSFFVEGQLVNREVGAPKMESFVAALGIMTEKDIVDGKRVSCHGQGMEAEWSPLTITRRAAR
ncbi:MAG TPA: DUF6081 family protein [Dehalococcoidia bacterium]|nr:DUF6081 family protein [Dehalococcoidia bacterium]